MRTTKVQHPHRPPKRKTLVIHCTSGNSKKTLAMKYHNWCIYITLPGLVWPGTHQCTIYLKPVMMSVGRVWNTCSDSSRVSAGSLIRIKPVRLHPGETCPLGSHFNENCSFENLFYKLKNVKYENRLRH